MSDYVDGKPWLDLPNPFGFEPLHQQIQHIYRAPGFSYSNPKPKSFKQRTSPVGRDWLGVGFQKGDILLGTVGGTNELLEVEEIFLDDGKGNPYEENARLVLQKSTDMLFSSQPSWQGPTELDRLEMSWIGNHLGLIGYDGVPRGLDDDFMEIKFQSFKVRCKQLFPRPYRSSSKRSLTQDQVTVLNQDSDRALLELRMVCREIPRLGNPMLFHPKI